MPDPAFKRILLKLSGEALMGQLEFGTDPARVAAVAQQVSAVRDRGVEVAIVVGAGNIYRGMQGAAAGMDRATADYMGMLATVLNALPLQDAFEKIGTDTRVVSALGVAEVAEPYIRRRAMRHLEKGRVVIFAAGTGNPFFTTDTAAALRAGEIHADDDPDGQERRGGRLHGGSGDWTRRPSSSPQITHMEAIERRLAVMDATALALCMENGMPLVSSTWTTTRASAGYSPASGRNARGDADRIGASQRLRSDVRARARGLRAPSTTRYPPAAMVTICLQRR